MNNSIFITYNPDSELERSLAIRLHTIGAVHGFRMYLPDRYNGTVGLGSETKFRIANSDWFILFSTGQLSSVVREEIQYFQVGFNHNDPARIIVIYDSSHQGRNLRGLEQCTEIFFDPRRETSDQVVGQIIGKIWQGKSEEGQQKRLTKEAQQAQAQRNGLAALLGVGLGLFALSLLSEESEKEEKKKSSKTKASKRTKPRQ